MTKTIDCCLKKLGSALLAVALLLSLVPAAYADSTGSITVSGLPSSESTTVSAYQLIDYENGEWVLTDLVEAVYTSEDDQASVLATLTSSESSSSDLASILTAVATYVSENGTTASATATTEADSSGAYATSATLSTTSMGSYLIVATGTDYVYTNMLASNYDATNVALVDATVTAKGTESGIVKTVDDPEVAVGDTVTYAATATFPNFTGTSDPTLVISDTMDTNLSWTGSVTVAYGTSSFTATVEDGSSSANATDGDSTVYTVNVTENGFQIEFSSDWLEANVSDINGQTFTVTYAATVDETTAADGTNVYNNSVTLSVLGNSYTDDVDVYTTGLTLTKTNSSGDVLEGVVFTLAVTKDGVTYYVASDGTLSETEVQLTTGSDGTISVNGLDPDLVYTISEVSTLDGYTVNSSTPQISFTVVTDSDGNVVLDSSGNATYTASATGTDSAWTVSTSSAAVASITLVNTSLGSLPSTGDDGMIYLTIAGIALMAGCGAMFMAIRHRNKRAK